MRKHRQKLLCLLVFAAASLAAGTATAADGKALYTSKGCVACHGDAGKAPIMPNYPKLAGQNSAYMLEQMKDIKSGKRSNGQTAVMKPIVAGVTEAEMKAIADYLSKE